MDPITTIEIESLSADHVTDTPVDFDWQDRDGEKAGEWRSSEGVTCPKCGQHVASINGEICDHEIRSTGDEDDDDKTCEGSGEYTDAAEGPMMSYYYPCDVSDIEEATASIAHLPLCIVEFDDDDRQFTALALTGGGMDLSWEICEAYVRLGYLPPWHFARNLPAMAGRYLDARREHVLKACERSLEVMALWAAGGVRNCMHLRRVLVEGQVSDTPAPDDEMALAREIAGYMTDNNYDNRVTDAVVDNIADRHATEGK